ncbi:MULTISPECIES: hypothetical protein [Streptomyces]|uniref:hypothetical protein n=1 Tax=Streptomyces TaxID=1883 RepID=UPI00068F0F0E|nr:MULTISPECIES: hypothetical protein [unclassified Streptomyces]ALM43636.1 hypothetical protein SFR_7021 [Streptomyces sp. FR-008]KAF0794897.1 hypothetical protein P405_17450 [Streptomyces sp. FR-008]WAD00523.1 hypothetical protein OSU72_30610 [Streptomyces sp. NA13]
MPAPVGLLTTTFYAFLDLNRPTYLTYASALLPATEATIAVEHSLGLIARDWTAIMEWRNPAARGWEVLTTTIAYRTGRTRTTVEDVDLLHDRGVSAARISAVTGLAGEAVTAHLRAARREHLRTKELARH